MWTRNSKNLQAVRTWLATYFECCSPRYLRYRIVDEAENQDIQGSSKPISRHRYPSVFRPFHTSTFPKARRSRKACRNAHRAEYHGQRLVSSLSSGPGYARNASRRKVICLDTCVQASQMPRCMRNDSRSPRRSFRSRFCDCNLLASLQVNAKNPICQYRRMDYVFN